MWAGSKARPQNHSPGLAELVESVLGMRCGDIASIDLTLSYTDTRNSCGHVRTIARRSRMRFGDRIGDLHGEQRRREKRAALWRYGDYSRQYPPRRALRGGAFAGSSGSAVADFVRGAVDHRQPEGDCIPQVRRSVGGAVQARRSRTASMAGSTPWDGCPVRPAVKATQRQGMIVLAAMID